VPLRCRAGPSGSKRKSGEIMFLKIGIAAQRILGNPSAADGGIIIAINKRAEGFNVARRH